MKKIIAVLMMIFGLSSVFAYEGFRFNKYDQLPEGAISYAGPGRHSHLWILKNNGYDTSKMTEVLMDFDAYDLLYNQLAEKDWVFIETEDYVGVTTTNGYWREYHLYRK